jgi:hypothetical protein
MSAELDRRQFLGSLAAFMGLAYISPKDLVPGNALLPLDDLRRTLPYFVSWVEDGCGGGSFIGSTNTGVYGWNERWSLYFEQPNGGFFRREFLCELYRPCLRIVRDTPAGERLAALESLKNEAVAELIEKPITYAKERGYTGYKRVEHEDSPKGLTPIATQRGMNTILKYNPNAPVEGLNLVTPAVTHPALYVCF